MRLHAPTEDRLLSETLVWGKCSHTYPVSNFNASARASRFAEKNQLYYTKRLYMSES